VDATEDRTTRNTWKRDMEREMWTVGFRFSWRKTEKAAQDKAARTETSGLWTVRSDKA